MNTGSLITSLPSAFPVSPQTASRIGNSSKPAEQRRHIDEILRKMPSNPFKKNNKGPNTESPEIKDSSRPLMYAQSDYAPSIAESTQTYNPTATTSAAGGEATPSTRQTHALAVSDAPDKPTHVVGAAYGGRNLLETRAIKDPVHDGQDASEEDFERPTTPPQGSRLIPWTSYHDLPADHPVFHLPAEKREEMYAKGVDPVLKATMDQRVYGKVYGQKTDKKQSFKGFASAALNQWGNTRGLA